ncbi:type III-A CRISPR-associated RAMP protein Csm3 [Uruburuella testudinis]|uniref:CRISPR system Cms endoribonuclease Csm3 n=1 Tax=Uruburuella testudinis TaxID=1282863 RepID=A0ABY4DQC6_9NEIS|nr:type III-A CRISPR-associated RAMP protein Csm3 [Uruburuella testudinis]UOO81241.1 type III-A CRISPR-associated RAMP protein Csm3 [Uruburuella testudinis]
MQLKKIDILEAKLVLQTGLHIGAGDSEIHIGGIDNSVIKHPVSGEPYIPGSSLKGKIRSLLEWKSGAVQEAPLGKKEYDSAKDEEQTAIKQILQLFGISGDTQSEDFQKEIGHTRVSFWDCALNKDYAERLRSDNLPFTEAKSENRINRIAGTAEHPRQTERVPAGAEFDFKLTIKQFDNDGEDLLKTLLKGLKLLELDSLGGSGSRGYGKVAFEALTLNGEDISADFDQTQPFAK